MDLTNRCSAYILKIKINCFGKYHRLEWSGLLNQLILAILLIAPSQIKTCQIKII